MFYKNKMFDSRSWTKLIFSLVLAKVKRSFIPRPQVESYFANPSELQKQVVFD